MRPRPAIRTLLLLAAAACGQEAAAPLTPLEACQRRAEINCSKAYECLEEPELELLGFPVSPEDCLAQLDLACREEPEEEFCAGGETYDPQAAGDCMARTGTATCEQLLGELEETYAPACADMCR